jgi:hypothetical protein
MITTNHERRERSPELAAAAPRFRPSRTIGKALLGATESFRQDSFRRAKSQSLDANCNDAAQARPR